MARRSQSSWALGLGLIAWIGLLFCGPLFFASTVRADDVSEYGTVIGIVSCHGLLLLLHHTCLLGSAP